MCLLCNENARRKSAHHDGEIAAFDLFLHEDVGKREGILGDTKGDVLRLSCGKRDLFHGGELFHGLRDACHFVSEKDEHGFLRVKIAAVFDLHRDVDAAFDACGGERAVADRGITDAVAESEGRLGGREYVISAGGIGCAGLVIIAALGGVLSW